MQKSLPLLCVVALFVAAACALQTAAAQAPAKSSAKTATAAPAGAQMQAKAKELYKIDCALCHNANGDGKTDVAKDMNLVMDDWTDPKVLAGKSDDELFTVIRKGKDKMPPEDPSRAKDDEVKALIQYIRSLAVNTPAAPAAAAPAAAAPAPAAPAATTPNR
ncbi:MAG TPA: cytochrome c [Terracidiphilus sp.]|nr:cytochrome c [Terracidiphilus sp.]